MTRIVSLDHAIGFTDRDKGPDLLRVLTLFAESGRRPLPLFLEPALAYAQQEANPKARSSPLDKAIAVYKTKMDNGYEPEWQLLYGDSPAEEVLDSEFVALCQEIICPLWRSIGAS